MYQVDMDIKLQKLEYEERVRRLQRLYGDPPNSGQPNPLTQLGNHLLFILGGNFVSLGERMQSHYKSPTPSPATK